MIADWLQEHLLDIQEGKIRVLAVDECHLLAGDICGRGWGNRQHRREVKMDNYRASQTYYGALDCISGEMLLSSYSTANSNSTIKFVKQIQGQNPDVKLVLVWDGASYHRSQEFREFLNQVNQGDDWQVHCLRFAPQRGRADRRLRAQGAHVSQCETLGHTPRTTGKLKACAHQRKTQLRTFGDRQSNCYNNFINAVDLSHLPKNFLSYLSSTDCSLYPI